MWPNKKIKVYSSCLKEILKQNKNPPFTWWDQGLECIFLSLTAVTSVVSDSVRPHRQQPTRRPCPWDSPGKNSGVGCHFLLQCMKVKSESEVAQSCPTLSDPMDCSLPGSSIHGIFQARVLEWGAIAFSNFSPWTIPKIPRIPSLFVVLLKQNKAPGNLSYTMCQL